MKFCHQFKINRVHRYAFYLLFLTLSLIACRSSEDKLRMFIDQFNKASAMDRSNPNLTCEAEMMSPTLARFTFRTNFDEESLQSKMMEQTMEVMEQNLVTTTGFMRDLIDDGISIDIICKSKYGNVLTQKRIDKSNIDSLIVASKSGPKPSGSSEMDVLHSMLAAWNQNMPMEDKEAGVKILGIDLGNDQSVIYKIQYLDAEIDKLLNDETVVFLKDEAMRNPAIQNVFNSVGRLGITKVKYHIFSSKSEKIAEFTIDQKEMNQ